MTVFIGPDIIEMTPSHEHFDLYSDLIGPMVCERPDAAPHDTTINEIDLHLGGDVGAVAAVSTKCDCGWIKRWFVPLNPDAWNAAMDPKVIDLVNRIRVESDARYLSGGGPA